VVLYGARLALAAREAPDLFGFDLAPAARESQIPSVGGGLVDQVAN
jgi:hypothetical protein